MGHTMRKKWEIVIVLIAILGVATVFSCSESKPGRPWGVSDETIAEIVKAKLGCEKMNVVVDNMGAPQTTCDQLGDCNDYADVKLSMDGVCAGRNIKASCVLRLYKSKMGTYRGDILKEAGQKN